MIIDVHGHVSAPDALYVYKANVLSHRGAHGRGRVAATDDQLRDWLTDSDRDRLFERNAAALFGLTEPRATHSQEAV